MSDRGWTAPTSGAAGVGAPAYPFGYHEACRYARSASKSGRVATYNGGAALEGGFLQVLRELIDEGAHGTG